MKTLLVATNRERSPYPVAPLGALCVAAAAQNAGHEVELLDLGSEQMPQDALRKALETGEFQAVALGIRNLDNCWAFAPRLYFDETRELAELVRQHFTGPLILGGSGFSVAPLGWMRRLKADCGVVGEGERAFTELLTRLETGRSLRGIAGVVTAGKDGGPESVLPARAVERLDELPLPAHHLCRYRAYVKQGGFVSVQTKRGCPFKCSYCVYPQLEGRRYRLRPPELVAEEIAKAASGSKVRDFFFVDSVFNDPRKHALAICAELSRRKLSIRWNAFCNPVGFDAELGRAMAQAGCSGVEFGLDVATPKMLRALDKPFDQEEIRVALQAARDARLPFAVYLLFGGPGETWADVEDTQAFLNSCAPASAVFATYGLRVYEGTPLARTAVSEGKLPPDQDLFEPAYYISTGLADNIEQKLDRIARRRVEWSSAVDWRRPATRWGQKVMALLNVRPQWKYMRGYGMLMRRKKP
jgi:radical SAM superfamily enzyme YgiQ (UPF0313 family)